MARATFDELQAAVEAMPPNSRQSWELLDLTVHLTKVCNRHFQSYVRVKLGWTICRRQAREAQGVHFTNDRAAQNLCMPCRA